MKWKDGVIGRRGRETRRTRARAREREREREREKKRKQETNRQTARKREKEKEREGEGEGERQGGTLRDSVLGISLGSMCAYLASLRGWNSLSASITGGGVSYDRRQISTCPRHARFVTLAPAVSGWKKGGVR